MGIFGSDPKIDIVDLRTKEQKGVSTRLGGYFGPRIGRGLQPYGGQLVAGMSPYERAGLSSLSDLASGGMPDIFTAGTDALEGLLLGEPSTEVSPELTERYFTEGIYDPMLRSMQEDIIPEIEGAYAGNYWGTPRAAATTGAWTDFEEDITSVLSELIYADEQTRIGLEESAKDRQLAATGVAGEMAALEENIKMGRIDASMTYGSLPRLLMQAQLDANYNEWLRTRPEYSPVIEQALSFMNTPGLTAVSTPGQSSAIPGMIGAGLGMAFGGPIGAGIGASIGGGVG